MTREEEISVESHRALNKELIPDNNYIAFEKGFCIGAKWADQEFANKVKKVSITYKYNSDLATKVNLRKDIIYDSLLIRLIEGLKRDGFIEIKEIQEDDVSTIFMCVNVLKKISEKQ